MNKLSVLGLVLGLTALSSVASAETSSFRVKVQMQSVLEILGGRKMPVMRRAGGIGREPAMQKLRVRLRAEKMIGSSAKDTVETDGLIAEGTSGDWRLYVRGSGEWIQFEDKMKEREFNETTGLPTSKRPKLADLEPIASAFIARVLTDVVQLGSGESLQPWSVVHQTAGSIDRAGAKAEAIVASEVIFTRTINGVAVLGAGSKVHVKVNPKGVVIGFSLDWADLSGINQVEESVNDGVALARVDRLRQTRGLSNIVDDSDLECGYYDAGAFGHRILDVRMACISRYRGTLRNGMTAKFSDVVPIGHDIVRDTAWPESIVLTE